jgi:GNAT superfamily N-acetyltransferase
MMSPMGRRSGAASENFVIRGMSRAELDTAIEWAAAEGWNPGLHDADAYYAADPAGYLIGLLDDVAVGSVSAVKYSPAYAFMGFFIVKPEHRGGFLGPRLVDQAFRHVGSAVAGLDGVLAQAEHYAEIWGFQPAYHNMRFEGVAWGPGAGDPGVARYTDADLEAIERYDRACFPAPRRAFLERWLRQPEAHALVYKDGDAIRGYGMIRPARSGFRIGPLFADDAGRAEALFEALVTRVPAGAAVYIDIPQPNGAALEMVTRRRMRPMFETARMYRGGAPEIAIEKVYGVTTLELG